MKRLAQAWPVAGPIPSAAAQPRWAWLAVLLATAFVALWSLGWQSLYQAPPLDSAEQLAWAYATEGGYWKHPPLPSWLMHGLLVLAGPSAAVTFWAAQLCTAVSLLLLWRVGCAWMGPGRSLLAACLTALVGYHGWGSDAFNHNTALLPFQAGLIACSWMALRRGHLAWWALVGLCTGLGMLVKYAMLLQLLPLLVLVAADPALRTRRTIAGLVLAALVAAAVFTPHLVWLEANGWQPLTYARGASVRSASLGAWLSAMGGFITIQLLRVLPLLAVLGWMARHVPSAERRAPVAARADRRFFWVMGAGPLVLVLLMGVASGNELPARWGATTFLLAGWLAVDALHWPSTRVAQALRMTLPMHLMLWLTVVVLVPTAAAVVGWQGRASFPARDFSAMARGTWAEQAGTPLRLVITDVWLGGTLVANHGGRLAVLIDGTWSRARWVTPDDLRACGALIINAPGSEPALQEWMARADVQGRWTLPWESVRRCGDGPGSTDIAWGVILPLAPQACRL